MRAFWFDGGCRPKMREHLGRKINCISDEQKSPCIHWGWFFPSFSLFLLKLGSTLTHGGLKNPKCIPIGFWGFERLGCIHPGSRHATIQKMIWFLLDDDRSFAIKNGEARKPTGLKNGVFVYPPIFPDLGGVLTGGKSMMASHLWRRVHSRSVWGLKEAQIPAWNLPKPPAERMDFFFSPKA